MKSRNLINREATQKQLDAIPIKYPFFQDFIGNHELHEELARRAMEQTQMNVEDIIVSCGDLFFPLVGKRREKNVDFSYARLEIERLCRGERPSFIHFHGPYLGYQSEDDANANSIFFSDGANMGCAAGIDGIHCRLRTHMIRVPWSDAFYDKLHDERGVMTFKDVKSLSCSQIEKKKSGRVRWLCDIHFKDGKGSYTNIFDEVNFEHPSHGDNIHPYTLLEDKEETDKNVPRIPLPKLANDMYDDSDEVYCSVIAARNNNKRLLSCFKAIKQ